MTSHRPRLVERADKPPRLPLPEVERPSRSLSSFLVGVFCLVLGAAVLWSVVLELSR